MTTSRIARHGRRRERPFEHFGSVRKFKHSTLHVCCSSENLTTAPSSRAGGTYNTASLSRILRPTYIPGRLQRERDAYKETLNRYGTTYSYVSLKCCADGLLQESRKSEMEWQSKRCHPPFSARLPTTLLSRTRQNVCGRGPPSG